MASESKRKLWSEESMAAATSSVTNDNMSLREASRLYNVPFETLRRRVNGSVRPGCKPGPATVLTEEEEEQLASYLIQMSEMGFGLSRDTVMHLAYNVVEKARRKHLFKDEKAGCAWFDGLHRRKQLFVKCDNVMCMQLHLPKKARLTLFYLVYLPLAMFCPQ